MPDLTHRVEWCSGYHVSFTKSIKNLMIGEGQEFNPPFDLEYLFSLFANQDLLLEMLAREECEQILEKLRCVSRLSQLVYLLYILTSYRVLRVR